VGLFGIGRKAIGESAAPSGPSVDELLDTVGRLQNEIELLAEAIPALELGLEDEGWVRLGAEMDRELSREAIGTIAKLARVMAIKNPLIKRAVQVFCLYVWGQGVNISCADEDAKAAIDEFMSEPGNERSLTGEQARSEAERELRVTGNLFLTFFGSKSTAAIPRVRTIPLEEITGVVRNPEDRSEPWFYKRETIGALDIADSSTGPRTVYHPDWQLPEKSPARTMESINNCSIEWDVPLRHIKVGGYSGWAFGVSEVYAALDWARAHKDQLESWSSILLALKRFAWDAKVRGGASKVSAAKAKLGTTVSEYSGETNPPPVAGAAFVHTEGNELKPIKTAGAAPSPEDTKYLLHMVCAGVGLPEFFFGNADVGNYATSKVLDRPTEMAFMERQKLWRGIWLDLCELACEARGIEPSEPITVEFPDILEHDVDDAMDALVKGITLNGKTPQTITDPREILRLVGRVLSLEGLDELLDKLYPEGGPAPAVAKQEESLAEALRDLAGRLQEAVSA